MQLFDTHFHFYGDVTPQEYCSNIKLAIELPNMPYDINISGMNLEINNETGRSTYGRFPYFQVTHNSGGGMFFAVGWPGQWRAGFDSRNGNLRVYICCSGNVLQTPKKV